MTALEPQSFGPLTRSDIVRYAGASGDFNPLHHDDEAAHAAGFPTVFAMGMLSASILGCYATARFGADAVRRLQVRFREQVWPGDILTCGGEVVAVEEGMVTIELWCRRQTGGAAVTGRAIFAQQPS